VLIYFKAASYYIALLERSAEYFYQVEMLLEGYAEKEGIEQCWTEAFKALEAMAAFVSETEGPFVEGNQVSYADFRIMSMLFFIKRFQQEVSQARRRIWEPQEIPALVILPCK
jgi:glutathione S-transferase